LRRALPLLSIALLLGGCKEPRPPEERTLPVAGYTAVDEPPFVVIGAGTAAEVEALATGTIRPAAEALRQDFFTEDPAPGLQIWLFPDAESRERDAPAVVARHDPGRDGYYAVADHVVVATLSVGDQAPLHYLVHAYHRANLPACPAWVDEGLGTLFEVSAVADGHLQGLIDHRLPGLQEALRDGSAPDLETLTTLSAPTFHGVGHERHEAAARYLCYYLQQHDLLRSFHRRLQENIAGDPHGSRALLGALGEEDLDAVEERWRLWTLALTTES
jgi:hypothetical protein